MLRIMMSSCLIGKDVMYWGGNFQNDFLKSISNHPEIDLVHFCPEHVVLGTPRKNMLIHGGDGSDLWQGKGKLLDTDGNDCIEVMKKGAQQMLEIAQKANPYLIIMTEGSGSCGSQVILDPETESEGRYKFKLGMGLSAALLKKNGFHIVGHRNEKKIYELLKSKFDHMPEIDGLKNFEM